MISAAARTDAAADSKPRTRDYISFSALSTYRSCPLRYYFTYVVGLPERTVSSSLVFGCAIHRGIEHFFNELMSGGEPPSTETLLGEYDRRWLEVEHTDVRFGKSEDRESLNALARRMFAAFQTSEFAQPTGRILGVEEELRTTIIPGCPDLLGRLDLIVETDDAIVVTDLKTSRSRWSTTHADVASEQLLLYHELVKAFSPNKRVRLQFAVLTKSKKPTLDLLEVPVNRHLIERTKRIVEEVWKSIEARRFFPAPSQMACAGCAFKMPCRKWPG